MGWKITQLVGGLAMLGGIMLVAYGYGGCLRADTIAATNQFRVVVMLGQAAIGTGILTWAIGRMGEWLHEPEPTDNRPVAPRSQRRR